MGPEGIGKYSLVRQVLLARAPGEPVPDDWCYVHNFADPRRPRALRLTAGDGRRFKERIGQLDRELRAAIPPPSSRRSTATGVRRWRRRSRSAAREPSSTSSAAAPDGGIALLRTPVGVGLAALREGKVLEREDIAKLPAAERERLARGHRRARGGAR